MKKITFFFAAMLTLTACTNNIDDENVTAPSKTIAHPDSHILRSKITEADFLNKVVGYGWKNEATYLVDLETGERETNDFWRGGKDKNGIEREGAIGGAPADLYFVQDKVICLYIDTSRPPFPTFKAATAHFDWENSATYYGAPSPRIYPSMYIESVDDEHMSVLFPIFYTASHDSIRAYFNDIFRRMTPEELEATCKKHGYVAE